MTKEINVSAEMMTMLVLLNAILIAVEKQGLVIRDDLASILRRSLDTTDTSNLRAGDIRLLEAMETFHQLITRPYDLDFKNENPFSVIQGGKPDDPDPVA